MAMLMNCLPGIEISLVELKGLVACGAVLYAWFSLVLDYLIQC